MWEENDILVCLTSLWRSHSHKPLMLSTSFSRISMQPSSETLRTKWQLPGCLTTPDRFSSFIQSVTCVSSLDAIVIPSLSILHQDCGSCSCLHLRCITLHSCSPWRGSLTWWRYYLKLPATHPLQNNLVFSDEISQVEFLCVHYLNPIPKSGSGNEHVTFIYAAFFPHYRVEFIECKLPPTN